MRCLACCSISKSANEAGFSVHKALGPGLLESAYLACLYFELSKEAVAIETQKALPLIYRGLRIDCAYRVDLIVGGQVIAALYLPSHR